MEQLEHSENQILELGNKIVKELDLSKSVDTLGKWMAQYTAELIHKIEICENEENKEALQKECSELILKLWKNKKFLPIDQPLSNLKPLIKILEGLNSKRFHFTSFFPKEDDLENIEWYDLAMTIKNNTIDILQIIVVANSANEILEQRKKNEENQLPLSKDEANIISLLEHNLKNTNNIFRHDEQEMEYEKLKGDEAKKIVFDKLDALLDEQKKSLAQLRMKLS